MCFTTKYCGSVNVHFRCVEHILSWLAIVDTKFTPVLLMFFLGNEGLKSTIFNISLMVLLISMLSFVLICYSLLVL